MSEIAIYTAPSGAVEVRLEKDSVWLRQEQMTALFGRDRTVIGRHIRNVFGDGELVRDSVCANFAHTAADGKTYQVEHYNLEVIISVGYRVKSQQGVRFRQWATGVLREHLTLRLHAQPSAPGTQRQGAGSRSATGAPCHARARADRRRRPRPAGHRHSLRPDLPVARLRPGPACAMSRMKNPAVYLMASGRNGTLYVGVTSNLIQRVWQHREGVIEGFTPRYAVKTLVWFEQHERMASAIAREKAIKKWNRKWKLELIERTNPTWRDLWPNLLREEPDAPGSPARHSHECRSPKPHDTPRHSRASGNDGGEQS